MSNPTTLEMMPLTQLLSMQHRKNPKRHDLGEIIGSITRNGFKQTPMIDRATGVMVAGHGRCLALERMRFDGLVVPDGIGINERGEWTVPTLFSTFKSETDRDAYVIADNRLTELGGYDDRALADMLAQIAEADGGLVGTGYDGDDLDELLGALDGPEPEPESNGKEVEVKGHTRLIGHQVRPPVQMTNDDWTLHLGDCLEGLRRLEDNSVDAIVMDPPAGISFMGREWDDDKGGRDKWIDWLRTIAVECLRVLKPGGHALSWALPRTSHWTGMALELAGFEVRDRVSHLFLSGFPKSLDVTKAIDSADAAEERDARRRVFTAWMRTTGLTSQRIDELTGTEMGYHLTTHPSQPEVATARIFDLLRPFLPPVPEEIEELVRQRTVESENLIRREVIGTELMADTSRVRLGFAGEVFSGDAAGATRDVDITEPFTSAAVAWRGWGTALKPALEDWWLVRKPLDGTYAENLEKWGVGALNIDASRIGEGEPDGRWPSHLVVGEGVEIDGVDEPAKYFYCPKPSRAEAEAGLDELPERPPSELTDRKEGSAGLSNPRAGAGRTSGRRNIHPCKKPIALMRYLVRLVTPRNGLVLDAFAGSGTTGLAALVEGCRFVGFEMSPEYHAIASERLRSIIEDPRQADAVEETVIEDPEEP